jgi:hypothetical protein
VQPLQSINYHDSRVHSHEQHGPFTQLDGFGWVGSVGFESSWFGLLYAARAKPVCMVLALAIGRLPVRVVWFWLQV